MTREVHVLADEEQMAATRMKQYEKEIYTGIKGRRKRRKEQGSKAKKQEIVLKASIVTKLPVSASKPNRGPCRTICHRLPTLVNSGIKYQVSVLPLSTPPSTEGINENQAKPLLQLYVQQCSYSSRYTWYQ